MRAVGDTDTATVFSSGAGIQYIVKPKEKMVVDLEYAQGKSDNYGVYLRFGYGF